MAHRAPFSLVVSGSRFSEDVTRKTYTLYQIQVKRPNDDNWVIERRYSDFVKFREAVMRDCSGLTLSLPPKKMNGNLDVAFVAKRLEGLQSFLDALQQYPGVLRLPVVLAFLEAPEACDAFRKENLIDVLTFVRDEPAYELNSKMFDIGARPNKAYARLLNLRDRSRAMLSVTQVASTNGITEDAMRVAVAWLHAGLELIPYVMPLRKATVTAGKLFTFTEYAELGSLRDVIYRTKPDKRCADKYRVAPLRPLPDAQIRRFGRQILLCLDALHKQGLAHGHVHTGNILVVEESDKTRTCKLTPMDALLCCVPPQRMFLLRRFTQVRDAASADIVMFGFALAEMATGAEWWEDHMPRSVPPSPLKELLERIYDVTRTPPTAEELLASEYFAGGKEAAGGGATAPPPTQINAIAKVKETIRLALEAYQKMLVYRGAHHV